MNTLVMFLFMSNVVMYRLFIGPPGWHVGSCIVCVYMYDYVHAFTLRIHVVHVYIYI